MKADNLDPNKRYLSVHLVKGTCFADFVNARDDEQIQVTASFLKNRYHSKKVDVSTDPVFDD